jgi:hypothetical protein
VTIICTCDRDTRDESETGIAEINSGIPARKRTAEKMSCISA